MAICVHRSNRTEYLVDALCAVLAEAAPVDPFQEYPVVIGSRGMERWLRHEIATRTGIAARLAFPFPRPAFEGAARWLLDPEAGAEASYWERPDALADALNSERMTFRIVELIRRYSHGAEFAAVAGYLELREDTGPVSSRELAFAGQVAAVLSQLLVDRAADTLKWARQPEGAPESHRWLAILLRELRVHENDSGAPRLLERLAQEGGRETGRSLCVFGLSTMSPGDREQLLAISQFMDVHLFLTVPTQEWFEDMPSSREHARALQRATSDRHRAVIDSSMADANPLLSALGMPSRDVQSWLEQVGAQEYGGSRFEEAGGERLLHRVQDWVLRAEPMSAVEKFSADDSVEFHRAYGAMRQCEVLRDRLMDLFDDKERSLEPRDVLVMTPDIQTYAPLLTAVFSRRPPAAGGKDRRLPEIPVSVADLGLRHTNAIAGALLELISLAGERLKASWLVDFMSLEPVRRRFRLGDDLAELQTLLVSSGFRWGEDGRDREQVDQPALDQNTARFAMERMALGVLMPDEDPRAPTLPAREAWGPVSALDVRGRAQTERVGQVQALMRRVMWHRDALREAASAEVWRERMRAALDDLTETSAKGSWLRVEVNAVLDDFVSYSEGLGERCLERQAVETWLGGRFEIRRSGDRPITGAVQICAMEPMRSVPFKVVALLGMDDGAFPRGGKRATWDPLESESRPGERDRREVDRHLLLESILSARERLLVFWTGFDVQRGQEQPGAVPIEELYETLTRLAPDFSVHEHALQPWSPAYLSGGRGSFDQGMVEAAERVRGIRAGALAAEPIGLMASTDELLPEESVAIHRLELDDLAKWLREPQKMLLRERLRIRFHDQNSTLEDREPLELDQLETWGVRDAILEAHLAEKVVASEESQVERVMQRLQGEGRLPLQAGGIRLLRQEDERVRGTVEALDALDASLREGGLEISLALEEGLQVYGRVERVRERGGRLLLEWYTASSEPNQRLLLGAWVSLLAAAAAGEPVDGARLVGSKPGGKGKVPGVWIKAPADQERAKKRLRDLVAVWRQGRRSPLRLFPRTSPPLGGVLFKKRDELDEAKTQSELIKLAIKHWRGDRFTTGDLGSVEVRAFFGDFEPWEELESTDPWGVLELSRRVWTPLAEAQDDVKDFLAAWSSSGEGA